MLLNEVQQNTYVYIIILNIRRCISISVVFELSSFHTSSLAPVGSDVESSRIFAHGFEVYLVLQSLVLQVHVLQFHVLQILVLQVRVLQVQFSPVLEMQLYAVVYY